MFAIQRLCLLLLLCSISYSHCDEHKETDSFEQTLSTVIEKVESVVPFEKYDALLKELYEAHVELESLRLLSDASKVQNELKAENREREKTILRDNCDLRINLATQNTTFCAQKLDDCDRNMKSAEAMASEYSRELRAFPGMIKKEDLIKVATGYYYISEANDKANWFIASNRCRAFGLELVSIETKEENDALNNVLDGNQNYWTSGSDQGTEGHFYWASTGQPMFYRNFDDGQPNDYGGEHCLMIWKEMKKWNDCSCVRAYRYICEYKRT